MISRIVFSFGAAVVHVQEGQLVQIRIDPENDPADGVETEDLQGQIEQWGRMPCLPQGTAFQNRVWEACREIPFGQTWNYRQLADRIGNPKAVRAVAQALSRNPWWLLVPCHRVIASDGTIGGYAGGIDLKRRIIQYEQKPTN